MGGCACRRGSRRRCTIASSWPRFTPTSRSSAGSRRRSKRRCNAPGSRPNMDRDRVSTRDGLLGAELGTAHGKVQDAQIMLRLVLSLSGAVAETNRRDLMKVDRALQDAEQILERVVGLLL